MSDDTTEEDSVAVKLDIFDLPAANELYKSLRQTAQARFEANRRLTTRDHKNNRLVATSSAVVIVVTILPYMFQRDEIWTDIFAFISVAMALSILVASLLHYSRIDAATAEQQHRSALEISEIRREMHGHAPGLSQSKFQQFSKRYDAILQKYSVNHDQCDMHAVIANRPDEYPWAGYWDIFQYKVENKLREITPDILTILIVLSIVIIAAFFYISDPSPIDAQDIGLVNLEINWRS